MINALKIKHDSRYKLHQNKYYASIDNYYLYIFEYLCCIKQDKNLPLENHLSRFSPQNGPLPVYLDMCSRDHDMSQIMDNFFTDCTGI